MPIESFPVRFSMRWDPPDLFAQIRDHCAAVPEDRVASYLGLLLHREIAGRPGGYEVVVRCRFPAMLGLPEEEWIAPPWTA